MLITSILFCNTATAASIKQWGTNVVTEGQSIGVSLISGGFVITGGLFIVGVSFAGQLLSKILLGGALIFGGATIAALLKKIFGA